MNWVTGFALGLGLFVVLPYVAHRLRKAKAEERFFAPLRLVSRVPPEARKKSRLEEKPLFWVRTLAILAMALLAATPLARCNRVRLARGGASVAVAIVLDDSMSMRAAFRSGDRFSHAKSGAQDLVGALVEGDSVSVVMAGAPPRVLLAPSSDLGVAKKVLGDVRVSDRPTDLDGALAMAGNLIEKEPQVDKKIALFSDMADGQSANAPIGVENLWVASPEFAQDAKDCAVSRADLRGNEAKIGVSCNFSRTGTPIDVAIMTAGKESSRGQILPGSLDVTIPIRSDSKDLTAKILFQDAIPTDNEMPLAPVDVHDAVCVVSRTEEGALDSPLVEKALRALESPLAIRALPGVPDQVADLAGCVGLILDDPAGFSPEQRKVLEAFVERHGTVLVALGPRAASPPLGASLLPIVRGVSVFGTSSVKGASKSSLHANLGDVATGIDDLGALARTTIERDEERAFETYLAWDDARLLIGRKSLGKGEAWMVGLPLSAGASDFPLRPVFLTTLEAFLRSAEARGLSKQSVVGTTWVVEGKDIVATGPDGRKAIDSVTPDSARVSASDIGKYSIVSDGKAETRIATVSVRELDLRPRAVSTKAIQGSGGRDARIDLSWVFALLLLGLMTVELSMRTWLDRMRKSTVTEELG